MRGQSPLLITARGLRLRAVPASYICRQCRAIQISAAPSTETPRVGGDAFGALAETTRDPAGMYYRQLESWMGNKLTWSYIDARFEVLGAPYSLLSVTLSASQKLYTRRGTLVAVAGKPENVGYKVIRSARVICLTSSTGPIDIVDTEPAYTCFPRSALSLPTDIIHHPHHSLDIHQISHDNLYGPPSRWHNRLDDPAEECVVGLDWTHPLRLG